MANLEAVFQSEGSICSMTDSVGRITLMTIEPHSIMHIPVTQIKEIADKITSLGQNMSVYYSLALRRSDVDEKKRGTLFQLDTMVCLAADIDIKGPAHKEDKLPETFEDGLRFLMEVPVPEGTTNAEETEEDSPSPRYFTPTIIINSGNGLHALWLFNSPVNVNVDTDKGKANLELAERISGGFGLYLIELGRQKGWNLDMVGDLPRMLRAPGSLNFKIKEEKPSCRVIYSAGPRYDLSDFGMFSEYSGIQKDTKRAEGGSRRVSIRRDNSYYDAISKKEAMGSAERLRQCAFINHCIEDASSLSEPQWHAMISIAALASDGRKAVHEWSRAYVGYSEDETDAYINRALEMQRPCSCRYIRNVFPGYCPKWEKGEKNPCGVKAPIRYCVLTKEEQITALVESKPDVETLLVDENLALASYAKKKDARLWVRIKNYIGSKEVNIGVRDYENAIKQYDQRQEEERKAAGELQPKDIELEGLDQHITSSRLNELTSMSEVLGDTDKADEESVASSKIPFRTPGGWVVDDGGIWKEGKNQDGDIVYTNVCHQPVVISKILDDLDDQLTYAEVTFPIRKKWRSVIVPRNILMSKSKVVDLAVNGLSIITDTAGNMNHYFRDFESINEDIIPVLRYAKRLGWIRTEVKRATVGSNGNEPANKAGNSKGKAYSYEFVPYYMKNDIMYVNNDEQRKHVLSAMHDSGDYDEWKRAADVMRHSTIARFMLGMSFGSPLLEMIDERSIPVHVHCKTMSGKTAALKCTLAIWGDPKLLMRNFNATTAGLEVLLGTMRNLPVCVDEVREESMTGFTFAEWVYMVGNEHGRTRAVGLASGTPVETWRTCAITTSEFPVTSVNTMDGVNSRLIEISGYPYEEVPKEVFEPIIGSIGDIEAAIDTDEATEDNSKGEELTSTIYKKIAEWTHRIVEGNYGQVGKEYITRLIEDVLQSGPVTSDDGQKPIPRIKDDFERMRTAIKRKCVEKLGHEPEHEIGVAVGALGDYYSSLFVFHIEDELAAWSRAVNMGVSVHKLLKDDEKQDIIDNAWGFVNDWVATNLSSFIDENQAGISAGNSDEVPKAHLYGSIKDDYVYAIVTPMNEALDKNGFPHGKCIQGFKERGYIETFKGTGKKGKEVERTSTSKSFGTVRSRVYVLKIDTDVFEDLGESATTIFDTPDK